jgi:16S rRNA (guanine966-N2)-methyltransferase
MLKIISGKYKGQKIILPSSKSIRPTTNMVREAVFDMIQFQIKNSIVLDVFSGSGAYGIESISRGATKAIFNDRDSSSLQCIRQSLEKLKIRNFDLFNLDYKKLLKSKEGAQFDIIFLDPPYLKTNYYENALFLIHSLDLLKSQGQIILEKNNDTNISIPEGLIITKQKKYGSKSIFILNKI